MNMWKRASRAEFPVKVKLWTESWDRTFVRLSGQGLINRLGDQARAGGLRMDAIAKEAGLDRATARNYLTYLDTVFLTTEVLQWPANLTSRLPKTPEVSPSLARSST